MEKNGVTWFSYQEDTDLLNTDGGNANLGGTITSTTGTSKPVDRTALKLERNLAELC